MRIEILIILEMYTAMLAIRMVRTLDPVFFESGPCGKVDFAIATYVVR